MAWSTSELADLAGTTVRAVRHYHHVGLLEEPRRRTNGYKQYGAAHLVRVLRIKRLADLGFTLPQIAELGDADQHPREALRELDAHLTRTLARLHDVHAEVRQILQQAAPTDLPPALAARIRDTDLSAADRALLVVLIRVLDPVTVIDFVGGLRGLPASPAATAFDQLPADADASTRHELSSGLLAPSRTLRVMLPHLHSATTGMSLAAARTLDEVVRDVYDHNPAQFDVLRRVGLLLRSRPDPISAHRVGVTVPQRRGPHSAADDPDLATLERRSGGRLRAHALDTTGATAIRPSAPSALSHRRRGPEPASEDSTGQRPGTTSEDSAELKRVGARRG